MRVHNAAIPGVVGGDAAHPALLGVVGGDAALPALHPAVLLTSTWPVSSDTASDLA